MSYKTELHMHTSDVSRCGHILPEDAVEAYIAAGYTTVVITNHYAEYQFDSRGAWEDAIDRYLNAYHRMKKQAGDRLHILLGAEVRTYYHTNDYLLYGVTEAFLRENRYLHRLPIKHLSPLCRKNGILLVHAHPCRWDMTTVNSKYLDGIEVFNGTPHTVSNNDMALAWAKKLELIPTSGSDFHGGKYIISGGIETEAPITSMEELVATLRSRNYTLICEGPAAERDGMHNIPAKF